MAEPSPAKQVEPIRRQYHGCSSIKAYEQARKLGEGTFGEVYQGIRKTTGDVVALKKILMHNEKEGFPITALREIKLLKTLAHENVIKLEEMAVGRVHEANKKARATLYMVTPYMEHDLSGMLDNPEIDVTEPMRKTYMQQLLLGLNYLHQNHILHRDMKAANLLINNVGILKIADFGLARHYEGPVPQQGKGNGEATRDYTSLVVTRWYRPPELLMQLRRYTPAIDMWGAGCVFGEMYKRKPILTGQSDLHQAQIIFDLVGSPTEKSMPGWTSLPGSQPILQMEKTSGSIDKTFRDLDYQGLSLLKSLLTLDWRTRINAIDALAHPYFTTPPLPAKPEDIPQFKDSHELDRRNNRPNKQALPPAPQGGTVGGAGGNAEWQGDRNSARPAPQYLDRYVPGERGASGNNRQHQSNRVPAAVHGREHGNGSRQPERDHVPSRVPAAARRPAGDADAARSSDERSQPRTSHLPPPPGQGARHPLPMNPLRKDTNMPNHVDRSDRPRRDDRDDRDRRNDRDAPRRDDRRSRTPDRRGDRYGHDRGERRPRDDYRDYDAPPRDRYRDDKRDDNREGRDGRRDRSPRRDHDRDRDRAYRDR